MARVAVELLAEARTRGPLPYALAWISLHGDLLAAGIATRLAGPRRARFDLAFDSRIALRRIRRSPAYAGTVLLILVLAIGGNTAAYQLLDLVLFQALPYPESDRLVAVELTTVESGGGGGKLSPQIAEALTDASSTLTAVAYLDQGSVTLSGAGPAEVVPALHVSTNLLDVLRTAPGVGRGFQPGEGLLGEPVALVSYGLAGRLFGDPAAALDRMVEVDGVGRTVVGVLPEGFLEPVGGLDAGADVWLPLALERGDPLYAAAWVEGIGRLQETASQGDAQRELTSLVPRLAQAAPEALSDRSGLRVVGLRQRTWGETTAMVGLLLGGTTLVLLIACANLAGLVGARATARGREVALCAALGAGKARVVRQVVTESALLAGIGGAGGLLFAHFLLALGRSLLDVAPTRLDGLGLDPGVLWFTGGTTLVTALLCGILPALRAARAAPSDVLREGAGGASVGRRTVRVGDALVLSQLTLSVALLVGAVLATRSLAALVTVDTGYDPDNVLTFEVRVPSAEYATAGEVSTFQADLLDQLRALPGVEAAGAVDKRPLGTRWGCGGVTSADRPPPERWEDWPCAESRSISDGYLGAMGIPLLEGRAFDEGDDAESEPVALVNEALVRLFWPEGPVLGRQLRWASPDEGTTPWRTVVGVVADVRHRGLARPADPEVYMPSTQAQDRRMTFAVRVETDVSALAEPVRRVAEALDPDIPLRAVATMDEVVSEAAAPYRLAAALLGAMALLSLGLALTGIHGSLSHLVSQRTREIGIRVSLGADPRALVRMTVGRSAGLAALGLMLGLPLAVSVARLVRSLLYRAEPLDPATLAPVSLLILATAIVASWLPARRALGVDVAETLRQE